MPVNNFAIISDSPHILDMDKVEPPPTIVLETVPIFLFGIVVLSFIAFGKK